MVSDQQLKVLIIYHGAALDPSKKIFEALAASKEIKLRVLAPQKGYNTFRNLVIETEPYQGEYELVTGKLYQAMKNFGNPYLTGLLREITTFHPDIIHVFHEAYSWLNVQVILYRNIFLPQTKCYSLGVENIIYPAKNSFQKLQRLFVHKYSDGVACWSTSAKNALQKVAFSEKKLHVTYWGVPLDQFTPSRNEKLRNQLKISDKFVMGYVGRFEIQKGLLTLLLSLQKLPESVHCLCVGDGNWREAFFKKVEELNIMNRIHWIPRVTDGEVVHYMNALDALVLPSESTPTWTEQFGRVLPEAMACQVPVIGSNSGAIPEVIGNAGMIFAETDYLELAHCVQKLVESPNLCKQMGLLGSKRAKELFSCKTYAKNLIGLYQ